MNISIPPSFSLSSPTPEQEIIFSNRKSPQIIRARAGSGKTSTILFSAGMDRIFCYNKAIAEEISAKGGNSQTWHAFCLGLLRSKGFSGRIDIWADTKHCYDLFPSGTEEEKEIRRKKLSSLGKIIPILKENLVSPADCESFLEEFAIPFISKEEVMFAMSKPPGMKDKKVSFSDLLVLTHSIRDSLPKIPFAWIDEAQDTNPIQLSIAESLFSQATFVGDPAQAIYSFRGAGMGSFEKIMESYPNSPLRTLSFSFRCAKEIIRAAQELVPDIQTFRTESGVVESRSSLPGIFPQGSAVLARTNKELLPILFRNLSAGRPVFFKDRAFLQDVLLTRVELENNGEESLREDIRKEKVKTARKKLEILLESAQIASQELLKAGLAAKSGPFLGTIHSAKGLEWDTVFLLDWDWQHPDYSPRAAAEESNLRYVGITRARNNLFFIEKGENHDN